MTSENIAQPAARATPLPVLLVAIPAIMTVAGLLLRYAAYMATVPDAQAAGFIDGLCQWDCLWYVGLAENGYDPFPTPKMIMAGNWAFFPAFPMIIGALKALTGLPTMIIATAVSILLANAAVWLAWPLLEKNLRAYWLYAAFVLVGPASIYFTTFYTEVLFLLMTTAVFVALRRSNYLLAGVLTIALSATRIVGVFAVVAIVVQALVDHYRAGGTWKSFVPWALRRPDLVLAVFIAPLGLFAYMAYLHFHIGDALAFQRVQRAWARQPGNPVTYLWNALNRWPNGPGLSVSQLLGLSSLVGIALAVTLAVRRQFAQASFSLISLVLPLSAGLASMFRFVVAQAPLVILAMRLVAANRFIAAIVMLALLAGGYFATVGWLTGYLLIV